MNLNRETRYQSYFALLSFFSGKKAFDLVLCQRKWFRTTFQITHLISYSFCYRGNCGGTDKNFVNFRMREPDVIFDNL